MSKRITTLVGFLILICLLVLLLFFYKNHELTAYRQGSEMMNIIKSQLELGERSVGSAGHAGVREYIGAQLRQAGVEIQQQVWTDASGQELINIVGRMNPDRPNRVIIGTHYDTKPGVPGANDGASGVAILLQLAKGLRTETIGVDLVFFDAEEFEPGPFDNWHPKGSTYFSNNLPALYPEGRPKFMIVPDLVCRRGLVLKREEGSLGSASELTNSLWESARKINGGHIFSNITTKEIKDDHTPLNNVGVPSVLLIDLGYPEFHTSNDNLDKCSPKSLEIVYRVIRGFLLEQDKH